MRGEKKKNHPGPGKILAKKIPLGDGRFGTMKMATVGALKNHLATYNPRWIQDENRARLQHSLAKFGQVENLVYNRRTGNLVSGHQRLDGLTSEGGGGAWYLEVDLSTADEMGLNVALNNPTLMGEWDMDKLQDIMDFAIDTPDIEIEDLAFDLDDYEEMFPQGLGEDLQEDEVPAVPDKPTTKPGDLYILGGKHRLLCGDSTMAGDMERLMDGKTADVVFTDPPYGISIVKCNQTKGDDKTGGRLGFVGVEGIVPPKKYREIVGDDKPFDPAPLLGLGKNQIIFGGNYFADKLPSSRGWIVWDKHGDMKIYSNFSDCELIWTSFDKPAKIYRHIWAGLVREGDRDVELLTRVHPTQKPVGLCERILADYTDTTSTVIDPFIGSGTTLIAADRLGRTCYGMEIDPRYCDVVVQRYRNYIEANGGKPRVKVEHAK